MRSWFQRLVMGRTAVAALEWLRTELDRTEGDLGVAVREAMRARAQVAELENAITWDTTCLNCAKLLDKSYEEFELRELAERQSREESERREVAEHRLGSLHQDMFFPTGGEELVPVAFNEGERFSEMRRWVGMRHSVIVIAEALLEQFGPKDQAAGDWRDYELEAEAILAAQAKA